MNPVVLLGFVWSFSLLQAACSSSSGDSAIDSTTGIGVEDTGPETNSEVAGAAEVTGVVEVPGAAEVAEVLPEPVPPHISLSWIAPVEREDGAAISMAEIAGYRVYYGTEKGVYLQQVVVEGGSTMETTLTNLDAGAYYIVVTAVDIDGRESKKSEEVFRPMI